MTNMLQDGSFGECVKAFSCIYNKKHQGHKDWTFVGNAWQKVCAFIFDIQTIKKAEVTFANLKKWHQKKRAALKRGIKFGKDSKQVDKPNINFKNYEFDEITRQRESTTKIITTT